MTPQSLNVEDGDSCSFVCLIDPILFIAMTVCIGTNQFGYWLWEWS